jgi:hypothetical protein
MTTRAFSGSVERLTRDARAAYNALPAASYDAADLRTEVTDALVAYYGADRVTPRNKCIKVAKRDGYVDADVVPCIQYRWYRYGWSQTDYIEGIKIVPRTGSATVNFPKEHIRNGENKSKSAGGHYKETVRQVKHLRNRAIEEGHLEDGVAPGYLLECMTFNAPDSLFVADDVKRLVAVVDWLRRSDKSGFRSCDMIHTLFGTDPGGFDAGTGRMIADALWEAL